MGLPRSGTSWLAKALSLSQGVTYYFEPDHELDASYRYKYLTADDQDEFLVKFIADAFRGKINTHYSMAEMSWSDILLRPARKTVLVKFVKIPLALQWLHANFPEIELIQIIRHPIPLFLSWQQRHWDPEYALRSLTSQERLMDGPLAPMRNLMEKNGDFWSNAATFWSAVTKIQTQTQPHNWFLSEHEWFCADAYARIKALAEKFGLQATPAMQEFLTRQTKPGPGYGKPRDSKREIDKWQGKIDTATECRIREIMESFELPFYPELDPWKTQGLNLDT
jgi:hypothetical protein